MAKFIQKKKPVPFEAQQYIKGQPLPPGAYKRGDDVLVSGNGWPRYVVDGDWVWDCSQYANWELDPGEVLHDSTSDEEFKKQFEEYTDG